MDSSNELREAINAWASVLIDLYEKLKKRRQSKLADAFRTRPSGFRNELFRDSAVFSCIEIGWPARRLVGLTRQCPQPNEFSVNRIPLVKLPDGTIKRPIDSPPQLEIVLSSSIRIDNPSASQYVS